MVTNRVAGQTDERARPRYRARRDPTRLDPDRAIRSSQLQQAIGRGESAFAVAGIPGARGFGFNGSQGPNANVAFAVGPDYYLVGFQAHANGGPTRAQLIAAAQSLYRRVRS